MRLFRLGGSRYLLKQKRILEMITHSQSPRDWILGYWPNQGGKMEPTRFRARTGMISAIPNPIPEDLAREGKIRLKASMQGRHSIPNKWIKR